MKLDPSFGYSIENSLSSVNENMVKKHGIKEPAEFLKACTLTGMTLAKIDSLVILKR